jgi:hypothetical protein
VARAIVARAKQGLQATFAAVVAPNVAGPVVTGGGILARWPQLVDLGEVFTSKGMAPPPVVPVADGVTGAAVLALRAAGADVGQSLFQRIETTLSPLRPS